MKGDRQTRFVHTADGVRLAHARSGRGTPLIRAAVWLSHIEHDWKSPVWSHILDGLSQRCTLVRYDERGCGLSQREVNDLSFEAWVRDLETVVDAQGIERFALIGFSPGAAIAIAYAVRHPERVTHLVLHGSFARGRLARQPTAQQIEEANTMVKLAELGWGRAEPSFRQFFTSQFIPGGTPEQHAWLNELERISTSAATAARLMHETNTIDITALLPQVRCPALVLHSRDDARVPFEEGRLVASGIPNAQLVPLASRNHLPLESEPAWAQWMAAVGRFLPGSAAQASEVAAFASLTPRQRELLELVAQGLDNGRAAAALGLTEKTVRNHVSAIFERLEVHNRAQAIVVAREAGFGRGAAGRA